jgi:Protein of unknown function (DUF3500)
MNALDATQQKQAILPTAVTDLVLGPGHDGETLPPAGLPAVSMTTEQQTMLVDLVGEWVGFAPEPISALKISEIKSHLPDTYFAWSGETTPGTSIYFRVTGPDLHIEFANQGAGAGGGPGGPGSGPGGSAGSNPGGSGAPPSSTAAAAPTSAHVGATGAGDATGVQAGGVNHIHTVYRDGSYGRDL